MPKELTSRAGRRRAGPEPASLRAPGMLMIGAAGRRCGKTVLACELVRRLVPASPVAAVKVTAVHEGRGPCPRGQDGCGVCDSLVGPLRLTEESAAEPEKDTSRLLACGARPVYWLCVRPAALEDGARLLVERLAPGASVCESNSLRGLVEPDLFVVARREGAGRTKPSCRAVLSLADLVVTFDGERLEPGSEAFSFNEGRWSVRRAATAVVLAGGRSRRMGRDKALLPVEGRPMIERVVARVRPEVDEVLLSANDPSRYGFLGLETVPDRKPGEGPMMAVASALARARNETVLVVPCDLPRPPRRLLARLLREAARGAEIVVPVTPEGHPEPLFAVYRRSVLPSLERALAAGERRIVSVYGEHEVVEVPLEPGEEVRNVNTAEDYEALGRQAGR